MKEDDHERVRGKEEGLNSESGSFESEVMDNRIGFKNQQVLGGPQRISAIPAKQDGAKSKS